MKGFAVPAVIGWIKLKFPLRVLALFPGTAYAKGEGGIGTFIESRGSLIFRFLRRLLRTTREQKDQKEACAGGYSALVHTNFWSDLHGLLTIKTTTIVV